MEAGNSTTVATDPTLADLSPGDTAWMLMSTGLVLLMTPGLGFFYVRACMAATRLSHVQHSMQLMPLNPKP